MTEDENVFYVYLHRRNDTNEVFYVGKGKDKRAWSRKGRNEWWKRVVDKCGYSVEINEAGMSEQSAFDLEVELIKFYKECGHTLCNMTNGGEGPSGCLRGPEYRKTLSEAMLKSYREKVVWTPERRAAMSEIQKKVLRPKTDKYLGTKLILCSNGMIFQGLREAVEWLKLHGWPKATRITVSYCCTGQRKTAYGFKWQHIGLVADMVIPVSQEISLSDA